MKLLLILLTLLVISLMVVHSVPLEKEEQDEEENDDDTTEDEEPDDEDQEDDDKDKDKDKPDPTPKSPTSLYHNGTQKSYEILTKGPCVNNLMFVRATKNQNEKYGDCACHQWSLPGHPSYIPMIYHPPTRRCYHIYQQAYCPLITDWLVYKDGNRVECVNNPCLSSGTNVESDDEKFVLLKGKCARIGESCSAKNENWVVGFRNLDVVPSCGEPLSFTLQLAGAHENLGCPLGHRPLANGNCAPVFAL